MSGHLILGKDTANNKYVPISVDSSGHLDIDVQVADLDSKNMVSEDGTTSGTQHQARSDSGGRLLTAVLGNTEANGSGTYEHLHTDGNGNLNTQIINTVSTNAFRTNIASGATNSHALVDADGHVQVDVLSGGGGDATAANQTTINTSIGTVNSTLGDTNSKIDAMRGTSDLGVINTSLGTVNSSIGDTNSKVDAMRASDSLTTVKDGIVQNLTDGSAKAKIMGLSGGGQYQIATDTSGHLQVDLLSNADTTKATSTNQSTMITSLASLAGCVSGTELQVDIVSGGGGGGGGDASAANQTTMINHLSEIEGAVETIETCVSGTELQVDVITSALPSGAATAANQTTGNTSLASIDGKVATQTTLASIDGKVATEATLAAAEAHIGTIDTSTASVAGCVSGTELQVDIVGNSDTTKATSTLQTAGNTLLTTISGHTSSIQSNVATSALQGTANTHLSEIEGAVETVEACVASNRLAVDTNNATHGTLAQLSVATGAAGVVSAILNTAGYSKLNLIVRNSTNTSTSITASLLWSDSASFSGGTDLVMSSEDLTGGAFTPISFSLATSADGTTYGKPQGLFSLTPPAQYTRVNIFQGTGSTLDMDFFYVLSR